MIQNSADLAVHFTVIQVIKQKRNYLNRLNCLREITQHFLPQNQIF